MLTFMQGRQTSCLLQCCTDWIDTGAQILALYICTRVLVLDLGHWCPASYTRSIQKFDRKKVRGECHNVLMAAYGTFLLQALQTDFGCAAVFIIHPLNELYPWSSIVLCRHHLASFA